MSDDNCGHSQTTPELPPAQKIRVLQVYVEYLKLKAEFGMDVHEEEIALLRAGVEDVQADYREIMPEVVSMMREFVQAVNSSFGEIARSLYTDAIGEDDDE